MKIHGNGDYLADLYRQCDAQGKMPQTPRATAQTFLLSPAICLLTPFRASCWMWVLVCLLLALRHMLWVPGGFLAVQVVPSAHGNRGLCQGMQAVPGASLVSLHGDEKHNVMHAQPVFALMDLQGQDLHH